jgi:hypothetical protein
MSQPAPIQVTCYTDKRQDLYAFSKLYTGLCLLAGRGEIDLRFASPTREQRFFCDPALTTLSIQSESGQSRLVAIDVHDRGDVFGRNLLDSCDIYLKRSYHPADIARLPTALQNKFVPFGLNYACNAPGRRFFAAAAPWLAARILHGLGGPAALREEKHAVLQFLLIPDYRRFEHEPPLPLQPEIVFQTRVWTQADCDTEPIEPLNESRVELVRALRKNFPKQFRGGVIPTKLAREQYPDALTREPTRPSQYLNISKRSLIGISTRGLHHSVPFKFPEYMAGSKCIVSEPLRNELPEPPAHGRDLLLFRNVDECLAICEELLSRLERARELRQGVWKYYQDHVEPAAHVRNCLERSMAPRPTQRTRARHIRES